jgi:ABC-type multidrug transport system fused ATPase/permease subunit
LQSTIRHADMICVVEKGMIVEKGKHDELLLLRGIYYDLVEHQISAQERVKRNVE